MALLANLERILTCSASMAGAAGPNGQGEKAQTLAGIEPPAMKSKTILNFR
jgi:hypothetical protein